MCACICLRACESASVCARGPGGGSRDPRRLMQIACRGDGYTSGTPLGGVLCRKYSTACVSQHPRATRRALTLITTASGAPVICPLPALPRSLRRPSLVARLRSPSLTVALPRDCMYQVSSSIIPRMCESTECERHSIAPRAAQRGVSVSRCLENRVDFTSCKRPERPVVLVSSRLISSRLVSSRLV